MYMYYPVFRTLSYGAITRLRHSLCGIRDLGPYGRQ